MLQLIAAAEERKKQRLELIIEGTEFVMAKYRFLQLKKVKIFYFMIRKVVYIYGGEIIIEKEIDKKYGYQVKTARYY